MSPSQGYASGGSITSTNPVFAVQADGKALLAGIFEPFYGYFSPVLKRFNTDGSPDTGFNPVVAEFYGVLNALVPQADGHLYIAGAIAAGNERVTYPLNRLNADGSLDSSFAPANDPGASTYADSTINALAVQPDGKVIAGGGFRTSLNGQAQPALRRFNADGSLDAGFRADAFLTSAGYAGSVGALALQPDGKVIVGGGFASVNGTASNNLVRLNADGSVDASFSAGRAGVDDGVTSIVLQPDGKILLGGNFTTVNGTARAGVARLDADGSLDPQFTPGSGIGTDGTSTVNSLALGTDGSVFVAGSFIQFDGQARDGVAELYGGDISTVTLTATTPSVTAGTGAIGEFTLTLSAAQDHDIVVNLTIKGSAVNGTDYVLLKTTKKIKAGKTTKPVRITPIGEG